MKSLISTAILLAALAMLSYAQETQDKESKKPKATYLVGAVKVTVWENQKQDGSTWTNFQVVKIYKKGEEWATSNSYNEKELLDLKEAIEMVIKEENVVSSKQQEDNQ